MRTTIITPSASVFDVVCHPETPTKADLGVNGDFWNGENGTSAVNPRVRRDMERNRRLRDRGSHQQVLVALRGEDVPRRNGVRLGTGTNATLSEGHVHTRVQVHRPFAAARARVRYDKTRTSRS